MVVSHVLTNTFSEFPCKSLNKTLPVWLALVSCHGTGVPIKRFPLISCSGDNCKIVDFPGIFVLVTTITKTNTEGKLTSMDTDSNKKNGYSNPSLQYPKQKKTLAIHTL